jgi:hypothetical protein
VKSLEREVLRLRSSENEALATAEKLQRQVDILLGTLAEHSISVPFGLEAALPIRPDIGHVTLNPRDPSLPLLNLTFPSSGSTTLPTSRSSPQKWINDTVQPEVFPPVDDQSTVPVPEIQTSLLHDPRVGIDFVLK